MEFTLLDAETYFLPVVLRYFLPDALLSRVRVRAHGDLYFWVVMDCCTSFLIDLACSNAAALHQRSAFSAWLPFTLLLALLQFEVYFHATYL